MGEGGRSLVAKLQQNTKLFRTTMTEAGFNIKVHGFNVKGVVSILGVNIKVWLQC